MNEHDLHTTFLEEAAENYFREFNSDDRSRWHSESEYTRLKEYSRPEWERDNDQLTTDVPPRGCQNPAELEKELGKIFVYLEGWHELSMAYPRYGVGPVDPYTHAMFNPRTFRVMTFTEIEKDSTGTMLYDVKVYSWGDERMHISPGNFDIVGCYHKASAGACHEIWKANVKHGWVPVNEWLTDYSERMKPAEEMEPETIKYVMKPDGKMERIQ